MSETWAEEVIRLRREIAERQARLDFLIMGNPMECVHMPTDTAQPEGTFRALATRSDNSPTTVPESRGKTPHR